MFSDGEKKRRVEAVRGLMQDEKLDVLLTIGNGCVGTNAYGCFRFLTAANVVLRAAVCIVFSMFQPRWYCRLRDILRGIEKCWNRD